MDIYSEDIMKFNDKIDFQFDVLKSEINGIKNFKWESYFSGISITFETIAYYTFIIKDDLCIYKQNLFTSCLCDLISIVRFQGPHYKKTLMNSISSLWNVFLSDDRELIDRYCNYDLFYGENSDRISTDYFYNLVRIYQLLYLRDWDKAQERLISLREYVEKKARSLKCEIDCLEAILNGDIKNLKKGLDALIKHQLKHLKSESYTHFIVPRALGMNKLALYAGLEYYHDSPLMPKELLEIKPLAEYEIHEAARIVMNGYTMDELYERFLNKVPFDQESETKRAIELGLIKPPGMMQTLKNLFSGNK